MAPPRVAHEQNVIGTMNILTACGGPDSPVRKVVFKSSAHYYGCERDDPSFFTESDAAPARAAHPPGVRHRRGRRRRPGLRRAQPGCHGHDAALLQRPRARSAARAHSALLSLPAVPGILGFDPRYQFIHEDDIVGALHHAATNDLPGIYNAAPDGVLALSEVASLLGKPYAPMLPPWGTALAAQRDGR